MYVSFKVYLKESGTKDKKEFSLMELEALHLSMWDCDHIGINSHKWATKINNLGF